MKKLTTLLILATFGLHAQTGDGAVAPVQEAQSNSWRSWVFAATAVVTATAAVLFISINTGREAPSE